MRPFRKKMIIAVVIIILLGTSLYFYEMNSFIKNDGVFWINDKQIINNEYFIYVGYDKPWVKLECTKKEYFSIIVDEQVEYKMIFGSKTHYPNEGKLIHIDVDNVYDNRNK